MIAIVTRPQHQGATLCESLKQIGFQSLHLPSLLIEPTPIGDDTKQAINTIDQADIVIATSANVAPYLKSFWPKHNNPRYVIAVGPSTRLALEQAGIPVDVTPERYSSEGVLQLPICQDIYDKKITILSGEGGKTTLIDTLADAGAIVSKLSLYRRLCPAKLSDEQLSQMLPHQSLVIFTSFDSLSNWWRMFPEQHQPWLLQQQTVVISETLQHQAEALGFVKPPWLADNATDQGIINCIQPHLSIEESP